MKKLIAALCVTSALAIAVHAEDTTDKKKHEMPAGLKELVAKYDANKDGKLDKEERAKMSAEDKAKMEKIHQARMKHKEHEAPATPTPNTAAPAPAAPATK